MLSPSEAAPSSPTPVSPSESSMSMSIESRFEDFAECCEFPRRGTLELSPGDVESCEYGLLGNGCWPVLALNEARVGVFESSDAAFGRGVADEDVVIVSSLIVSPASELTGRKAAAMVASRWLRLERRCGRAGDVIGLG